MMWSFILIPLVIAYLIASYQVGHRIALKGMRNVLVCLAAGYGIFAFLRLFPSEWEDHALSGFFLFSSLSIWVFLTICLRRIARAGDILLEIGRPRGGLVFGVVGTGVAILAGVLSILQAIGDGTAEAATQIRYVSFGLFYFALGTSLFFSGFIKSSIREHGIVVHGQILKWAKIEGFQWDTDHPSTLALRVKRRFPLWRTLHLPVPSDKQAAATEILESSLSR